MKVNINGKHAYTIKAKRAYKVEDFLKAYIIISLIGLFII